MRALVIAGGGSNRVFASGIAEFLIDMLIGLNFKTKNLEFIFG
jgi:hypothetical protein